MKKFFMTWYCLLCCIMALSVTTCFGQADIKTRLLKDVVKTENGKYSIEEIGFIVTLEANVLEVEITASSPSNLMSRDNFSLISSSLSNALISSTLKMNSLTGNSELVVVRREKPVKPADITVHIEMKAEGVSYKVTMKGFSMDNKMTWDQFFFEKM